MSEIGIFDTTKDVVLKVNIFQVGLQDGKPDKVRYAIIEKEMFEMVWQKGCMQIWLLISRKSLFLPDTWSSL